MMSKRELVEGLRHNAAVSGGKPLERLLADTALWFSANVDSIPRDNLASKQAFLEKAFWCQLELNALLLERLRNERASKALYLPSGVTVGGDVRRYG
jgi:predicted NACHT family NTPase